MKKVNWQYYFARKLSLQRFEVVSRVYFSDFYWQHFKVKIKNSLIKPEDGGNHGIWLEPNEYNRAIHKIFNVVYRDLKHFYYYKRLIKSTQKKWLEATKKVAAQVQPGLPLKKLAKLYDLFIHHHQEHFNKPIWIPFFTEPVIAAAADQAIKSILKRAKAFDQLDQSLQVVFAPEEQNAISALQQALLTLAVVVKSGRISSRQRIQGLQKITKQFGFIPCYDVIDAPWDVVHFQHELQQLLKKNKLELVKELQELRVSFTKRHQEFQQFLKKFSMTKRERELCIVAHELVFIKDERDDYRRHGCYYGRGLFEEIGRRLGVSGKEAAYLTIDETKQFLQTGVAPVSIVEIKERAQGYLILRKNGQSFVVASGNKMREILRQELGEQVSSAAQEVRGTVGSVGLARGPVVIVHTKHDLRRVKDGDIMVAVTTNPDFVPAMRRCKAIVTDEGGMTSHAAIVTREWKVPCVVGTKIATKVFRDGDMVEVDARRGVVRKL